jgi:hypothetical protein
MPRRLLPGCAAFLVVVALPPALPAGEAPFIQVDPASTTSFREAGTGLPWVAIGVNYFDPETGWAPQLWHKFDESRVRKHLQMLHDQGFNAVRVFLTYDSFHREPGKVSPEGEAKFRKLLAMCRELGIYVNPSGPDHWEGVPEWRRGKDMFADETILAADEAWWRDFAGRFTNEPAIFAYDLYNEPMTGWDTPAMREKWNRWLKETYGSVEKVSGAWKRPASEIGELGTIAVPPGERVPDDARLFDYQRFREHIASEWARRLCAAIRSVDENHLVTVGCLQSSATVLVSGPQGYTAFAPQSIAKHLDFLTIHFYPLYQPRPCDSPEGVAVNRAYLEATLYQYSVGKPLMLGEFGWYGGGGCKQWGLPPEPPEHQLEWCQTLLDVTEGRVCGWLNWAFADTPTSTDVTIFSGLWTTDLRLKPWGRVYGEFAREHVRKPLSLKQFPAWLTALKFDHRALITDPHAADALRRTLRVAASQPAGR